jgi:hypothetical protein
MGNRDETQMSTAVRRLAGQSGSGSSGAAAQS